MKRVPYAYVPVYFGRSVPNKTLNELDVLKLHLDSPLARTPNATINSTSIPCVDEQTCILSVASGGLATFSIDGISQPYSVSVYRAPAPSVPLPANAYPSFSGSCNVTYGGTYYECADYHKITAASDLIMRAGFVTSGAVRGSMSPSIDAASRRLMSVVAGGAAHGYLLEVACSDAFRCAQLGVLTDPAFGTPAYASTLGWALYRSKGNAPPPPNAPPAPSIVSISHEHGFYYYAAAGAGILIIGAVLCCILYKHYEADAQRAADLKEMRYARRGGHQRRGTIVM